LAFVPRARSPLGVTVRFADILALELAGFMLPPGRGLLGIPMYSHFRWSRGKRPARRGEDLTQFARTAALLLLFSALFIRPLVASTILFQTDAQLIARSERVVHARAIAQRSVLAGPRGQTIYTVTTLSVIEDFTAQPGDTIEVWELGGVVGNQILYVGGAVEYRFGEEVLVCLERGPRGLRSVAMGFSKFDVQRTAAGDVVLQRNAGDSLVVGGTLPAVERSLDGFRQLAAQVTGRSSRRGGGVDGNRPALHQVRWRAGMAMERSRPSRAGELLQKHDDCSAARRRR
jgi:hypothetical protein